MTQCGIDCWGKSMEKEGVVDYRFLAKTFKTAELKIS
jgi:hypothetical protein